MTSHEDSTVLVNDQTDEGSEDDVESDASLEAATDTGTSSGTDSEKLDAAGSPEDSDDALLSTLIRRKIKPKVGNFYIIQFETGKQISRSKHYVGKILSINDKEECEIMFARLTQRTSLIFTWREVVDKSCVDIEQLKFELTVQKQDRQGRLVFPCSEPEPFKNSLQ